MIQLNVSIYGSMRFNAKVEFVIIWEKLILNRAHSGAWGVVVRD